MTEIDDEEWDRWMSLTEAEQDAELRAEVERFDRVTDAMSLRQHAAALRRMVLGNCLSSRRLLRQLDIEIFRESLRQAQKSLVKIRAYRTTGIYPGEAS